MPTTPTRLRWMDALLDSDDSTIDSYAVAVAFALLKHMSPQGVCRVSIRRLAKLARCSTNVVMDRIARIEQAGLLHVERRHRSASTFRATPGAVSPDETDHGPDLSHPTTQTDDGDNSSVSPDGESVSPGGPRTLEPSTPTSRKRSTHEEPPPAEEPKGKITPKRILTEMARRKLGLAREQAADWAPPEGCDPRRERGWLAKEFDALQAQHGFELDAMIARLHPEHPAQPKHADPDYYVWRLDPALARRDWGIRNVEETRADLERDRAAAAARMATPEQRERNRQGREQALALKARLRAQRQAVPA